MQPRFYRTLTICAALLAAIVHAGAVYAEEKPLTNDDVIALAKAGLGDDLVVSKVQQAPKETLDVSTDALIALKKAGLAKPIIDAMLKRVAQRSGPSTSSPSSVPAPQSSLPLAKPRKAGDPSQGQPCVANFSTEGGFWKGEGKTSFQDFPKVEPSDKLFEHLSQSVASGGWQITLSNKDSGTVSGFQEIHQMMSNAMSKATLNVLLSRLEGGGLRVEATMMVPSGTKVTDKDAKKVFCRIFESVTQ